MVVATFLFFTMLPFLALAIFVCVGCCVLLRRKPVALETPSRAAGPRAGFDILPCPSSLVTAPPLAVSPRPHSPAYAASGMAMGRGMILAGVNDFISADSVEITIDGNCVWVEVNGRNVLRVKNVKRPVELDDRRVAA